jgi:hypothetical protein
MIGIAPAPEHESRVEICQASWWEIARKRSLYVWWFDPDA